MQAVRNLLRTSVCRMQTQNMATAVSKDNSRRMKYPYTMTAKVAMFPWRFHYEGFWLYRALIPGSLLTVLLFWKINQVVNSPGNVAAYEARKARDAAAKHQH